MLADLDVVELGEGAGGDLFVVIWDLRIWSARLILIGIAVGAMLGPLVVLFDNWINGGIGGLEIGIWQLDSEFGLWGLSHLLVDVIIIIFHDCVKLS